MIIKICYNKENILKQDLNEFGEYAGKCKLEELLTIIRPPTDTILHQLTEG